MKNVRPLRALVARDRHATDRAHARALAEVLRARGFHVLEAEGPEDAWRLACADGVDVLLAQFGSPDSGNFDLLRRARRSLAPQPGLVAIVDAHELERDARTAGAHVTLRSTLAGELVADTAQRLAAPCSRR